MTDYNESMFIDAEKEAVDWLLDEMGHELFKEGRPGELTVGAFNQWAFSVTGPSLTEQSVPCAVNSAAMLEGVYQKRQDAQRLAGAARAAFGDALNVTDPTEHISTLRWVDDPTFLRSEFVPANSRDGKSRRYWRVEIPLQIVFSTTV